MTQGMSADTTVRPRPRVLSGLRVWGFGGVAVAWYAGIANIATVAVLALILSMVSQAGDLFESAVKRRFDTKDASGLIPGHGGVMDRVDGFVVATLVAASVGVARGGMESPAQGLLVW